MTSSSAPVPDKAAVLARLDQVRDPKSGQGLATAGLVRGLVVSQGRAGFMLEVSRADVALYAPVRDEAERVLSGVEGIETAQVVLTTDEHTPAAPPRRGAKLSPDALDQGRPRAPVATDRPEHVKRVVAVASGKGGVGKSSVAVNLAVALAHIGLRVGLMDADVYGPSAPLMLGLSGNPAYEDGKMVPLASAGLVANSIGLLVEPEQAMIWRGPMASQAITQLLTQTRWGTEAHPMDVLIVDLPPGTGDVQLTLVQKTPLDGAVIVSTPQEAALIDARRAVTLFGKTNTPVLGVVENMAYFSAPDGSAIEIFGRGGARSMAEALNVPFLGEVPLDPALRVGGDTGRPLMASNPEAPASKAFEAMATSLRHSLGL